VRDGALRMHRRFHRDVVLLLSRLPKTIGKRIRQLCVDTAREFAVAERATQELRNDDRQRPAYDPRILWRLRFTTFRADREHFRDNRR